MDEHNEIEGMYPSRVLANLGNVGHSIDCFSMPSRAPLHQVLEDVSASMIEHEAK